MNEWQPIETFPKTGAYLVTDEGFEPGMHIATWHKGRISAYDAEIDACWDFQGMGLNPMWHNLPDLPVLP